MIHFEFRIAEVIQHSRRSIKVRLESRIGTVRPKFAVRENREGKATDLDGPRLADGNDLDRRHGRPRKPFRLSQVAPATSATDGHGDAAIFWSFSYFGILREYPQIASRVAAFAVSSPAK